MVFRPFVRGLSDPLMKRAMAGITAFSRRLAGSWRRVRRVAKLADVCIDAWFALMRKKDGGGAPRGW
ncbi:MAG: hypothetical protein C0443_07355 [Comamonadaceae bacterium]|nr:hypothetical protein [Comamonadaceae bacterium]